MCGVAGQVRFDGEEIAPALLEKFSLLLEHRGRDSIGCYRDGPIGLVHRRLSIIDPTPSAYQPMPSAEGDLVVTFNGEIFNYLELHKELEESGCVFRSKSDTEVLLHAYKVHGINFLDKIEGMFAFALWDRSRRKLYLVRDRMGIKPLYYHVDGRAFSFASEIKALVKSGVCPAQIDPKGLKEYLHLQLYLGEQTLFRGIHSLEPGQFLCIDPAQRTWKSSTYWSLPDTCWQGTYEDAVEELRARVADAVRLWSRADVPISAYVSGGLDSSAVASLATHCVNSKVQRRLITFSSLYNDGPEPDERACSDAVAANIGSDHHQVFLDRKDVVNDHLDLLYALDMPIAGYSAAYRTMAREVRRHTRVVLTGHGGDELFAGYPKYVMAMLAAQKLSKNPSKIARMEDDYGPYIQGFESQAAAVFGHQPKDERDILRTIFFRSDILWDHVVPEIKKEAAAYDIADALWNLCANQQGTFLKRLLVLDQRVLLPGLLHVEDRTSMMENLESRTPFLDRRIVEFAAGLSDEFLLKNGLKGMMRTAVLGLLPDQVARNPRKSGVLYPTFDLLENDLREHNASALQALDQARWFTVPAHDLGKEQMTARSKRIPWALWSLGSWIQTFQPVLN